MVSCFSFPHCWDCRVMTPGPFHFLWFSNVAAFSEVFWQCSKISIWNEGKNCLIFFKTVNDFKKLSDILVYVPGLSKYLLKWKQKNIYYYLINASFLAGFILVTVIKILLNFEIGASHSVAVLPKLELNLNPASSTFQSARITGIYIHTWLCHNFKLWN